MTRGGDMVTWGGNIGGDMGRWGVTWGVTQGVTWGDTVAWGGDTG